MLFRFASVSQATKIRILVKTFLSLANLNDIYVRVGSWNISSNFYIFEILHILVKTIIKNQLL